MSSISSTTITPPGTKKEAHQDAPSNDWQRISLNPGFHFAGATARRTAKRMKPITIISVAMFCLAASALGHPQAEHLKEAYKAQGDGFFVPLYWLPETRQTVVKHIPDHDDWVGFEFGYWKKVTEAKKIVLLEEIGERFDGMESEALNRTWQRVRDWDRVGSQLSLLSCFFDQDEGFLDMAFDDPSLRPAFKWLTDRRKPGFDTKHIGSSFTSGEMALFYPQLIQHLLDMPERERLMCFSRLLARIAATKPTGAGQDGGGNGGQPPTHSGSK